jgi:hypothetical protein
MGIQVPHHRTTPGAATPGRGRNGVIIRTGCGHHFDSETGISEPNRAGWADEIARLTTRDPGDTGCLFDCPACGTEQILIRVGDERVITALTMSDYLASIDGDGPWVSASF